MTDTPRRAAILTSKNAMHMFQVQDQWAYVTHPVLLGSEQSVMHLIPGCSVQAHQGPRQAPDKLISEKWKKTQLAFLAGTGLEAGSLDLQLNCSSGPNNP
eukprot:scaffold81808_cov18-Tisochrysis_lutea.AAC.1